MQPVSESGHVEEITYIKVTSDPWTLCVSAINLLEAIENLKQTGGPSKSFKTKTDKADEADQNWLIESPGGIDGESILHSQKFTNTSM